MSLDCENTVDREKVALTLALWRRKAPQCESERDFFTIIPVFIVKNDENRKKSLPGTSRGTG